MTGATLALDPGWNMGWAIFLDGQLAKTGVIIMPPPKDDSALQAELNSRRCQSLASELVKLGQLHGPFANVVMEGFGAGKSYQAVSGQNQVLGVVSAVALSWGLRIRMVSPQAVKKVAAGEIEWVRLKVKPLRARLRELNDNPEAAVECGVDVKAEIARIEAELAPLERQRAKAEKAAIIAFAERKHPRFDFGAYGARAEHVADAVAIYHVSVEKQLQLLTKGR